MYRLEEFDHRTAHDSAAGSLRNLAEYYDWETSEATALGLGGGIASVAVDRPEGERRGFLGRPPWVVEQFFESLDASYHASERTDLEGAFDNVTERLDADQPVILFFDPEALDHVPPEPPTPRHVVVAIGYSEGSLLVSDPTQPEPAELSQSELRAAWAIDGVGSATYRWLAPGFEERIDLEDAANRAVRQATAYHLDTRSYERTLGKTDEFGEHGPDALRALGREIEGWTDLDDTDAAIRDLRHGITEAGRGAAYRAMYADALETLAVEADVGGARAGEMRSIVDEWEALAEHLGEAAAADTDAERSEALAEAGSVLGDIAEREKTFFAEVRDYLRT
jgi:hypothetical protein